MSTVPAAPSTAALVERFGERACVQLLDGVHGVASPLGIWVLVALLATSATETAPGSTDADLVGELAEVLGVRVEEAARRARDLLAVDHRAVALAAALWSNPTFLTGDFETWRSGVPSRVEQGPVPSQAAADRWADERTGGLIERFPITVDALSAVVAATALATRVTWDDPFGVVDSERLGSPWSSAVRRALWAPPSHDRFIALTDSAGDVAVHDASAREGVHVISVIADPDRSPASVHVAASEVARLLAGDTSRARRRSLFELSLGAGHSWTIEESEQRLPGDGADRIERVGSLVLPAWSARSDHELMTAGVGLDPLARAISRFARPDAMPLAFDARQSAVASYTRLGFEAAAVTAFGMRAGSAFPGDLRTVLVRTCDITFRRPYAAVAIARPGPEEPSPWRGMPLFTAWIAEPAEVAEDG